MPRSPHTVDALTNYGGFRIRLDVEDSPCVTSSFASLVRKRFFDGTIFHRIVPGFVIQGGDPTGTATAGPATPSATSPPRTRSTPKASSRWRRRSASRPGRGQPVLRRHAPERRPAADYAILGSRHKGLKVVERIGRLGNRVTEQPTRRVVVLRMTLV
jgi:hypothetical protein